MSDPKETSVTSNTDAPDVSIQALIPITVTNSTVTVESATAQLAKVSGTVAVALRDKLTALLGKTSPNKKGMEEVESRWQLSSIRIKQPVTTSESCPDAARPGDLYTTSGELLPKEIILTPIKFYQSNVMFEQGSSKLLCSAPDARLGSPLGWCKNPTTGQECQYLPMGLNARGEKTACTNNLVAICVTQDLSQIVEVIFAKTSRKAGNALQRLAGVGQFVWEKWYKLTTEKQTGGQGVYFTFNVKPTGEKVDPETIQVMDALSDLCTAQRNELLRRYYMSRGGAAQAAKATEAADEKALMEGLSTTNKGEEPTFVDAPPVTATKTKNYKGSM